MTAVGEIRCACNAGWVAVGADQKPHRNRLVGARHASPGWPEAITRRDSRGASSLSRGDRRRARHASPLLLTGWSTGDRFISGIETFRRVETGCTKTIGWRWRVW